MSLSYQIFLSQNKVFGRVDENRIDFLFFLVVNELERYNGN